MMDLKSLKRLSFVTILVCICVFSMRHDAVAATITVDSLDDDGNTANGNCNLREAIQAANGDAVVDACTAGSTADVIVFSSGLTGTIDLGSALPTVTESLRVTGPGASSLTIDANQTGRIFLFDSPTDDQIHSVSGMTVTGGMPGAEGGGIAVHAGDKLTISNCIVSGNVAADKGYGGGVYAADATVIINDSAITNNQALTLGGGVAGIGAAAVVTIHRSLIAGNAVTDPDEGFGGGLTCESCTMTIVNSTIADNRATISGGGIAGFGTMMLRNVTVVGNQADSDGIPNGNDGIDNGGGIVIGSGDPLTIRNSVVAGNTDGGGEAPDCYGTLTSEDFNLIQDATACTIGGTTTNNLTGDPLLAALADNGGPTQTRLPQTGSPLIDAGDPSGCVDENDTVLIVDQRNFTRPFGVACDIGAVEVGCGNGQVETDEECDDGNNTDGDGCSADCLVETPVNCGDATVDDGEECDDGNTDNGDGCSDICALETQDDLSCANPDLILGSLTEGEPVVITAPDTTCGGPALVLAQNLPDSCSCTWSINPSERGSFSDDAVCTTTLTPGPAGIGQVSVAVDCGASGSGTYNQSITVNAASTTAGTSGGGCSLVR